MLTIHLTEIASNNQSLSYQPTKHANKQSKFLTFYPHSHTHVHHHSVCLRSMSAIIILCAKNLVAITNGSNKSSGSSNRGGLGGGSNGGNNDQDVSGTKF